MNKNIYLTLLLSLCCPLFAMEEMTPEQMDQLPLMIPEQIAQVEAAYPYLPAGLITIKQPKIGTLINGNPIVGNKSLVAVNTATNKEPLAIYFTANEILTEQEEYSCVIDPISVYRYLKTRHLLQNVKK